MHLFTYPTSQAAWIGLNKELIHIQPSQATHAETAILKNQAILFDVLIRIKRSWIDPEWDFTKTVNYTQAKWTSLVNNYLNRSHLEEVVALVHHRELKKDKNYNVSMWFGNNHTGGKGCLLSCTFSRRYGSDEPVLNAVMRSSEFYKRGMFDLLLLHRLGQEAWGEDAKFRVNIFAHMLWGGSDWLSLLALTIPKKELFDGVGSFGEEVRKMYKYFQGVEDIEAMKYHAHKRAAKVIQGKINNKHLLVKHCNL